MGCVDAVGMAKEVDLGHAGCEHTSNSGATTGHAVCHAGKNTVEWSVVWINILRLSDMFAGPP